MCIRKYSYYTIFSVPTNPEMTDGEAVETVEPHGILYADNRSVIVQSGYNMGKLSLFPIFLLFLFCNPKEIPKILVFGKSKLFVNLQGL